MSDAAKQKLLDELLQRRKARQLKRLEQRGREEFPEHIERRHITLDLDEEAKQGLTLLDVKLFERMCFERPHAYIEVIHRHLYVRSGEPDAGVFAPPAPLGILPGVKYDFSVIAAALSMKLNFHQPTYRQQDMFAQAGYFPSRSTLNDWFNYSVIVIEPLFAEAWRLLLQQEVLLGDDTRVRLLTRGALEDEDIAKLQKRASSKSRERPPPGSVNSYVWLYTGLDGAAPYDIFHWSLTHEDCWIDSHLKTYHVRNHWVALQRYLSDARLPIDNNQSERTIRPFVIGRHNWTFLGHPQAAPGRLKLFSIASSAHRHGPMVHDYFEDVLRKLAHAQQREPHLLKSGSAYLQALLPDRWAQANSASVCHDRRDERDTVAESKQIRYLRNELAEQARREAQPSPAEPTTAG